MDVWLPPSPLFHDPAMDVVNFKARRRVAIRNLSLPDYFPEHGDDSAG